MRSVSSSVEPHRGRKRSKEGEGQVSARVGSLGSIDQVHEDFNRDAGSRATGYMGKNSDLSWMQRLKTQVQQMTPSGGEEEEECGRQAYEHASQDGYQDGYQDGTGSRKSRGLQGDRERVSNVTYHCDDIDLISPDQVISNELPPRQTIEILVKTYIDSIHPVFPIIGRLTFTNQVSSFLEHSHLKPGDSWLAILNLIFAIAAKYSHLVQTHWRGDERDHLVYFARARALGMNDESIFEHPDLQRVQVLGLMAFYLLSINQINR